MNKMNQNSENVKNPKLVEQILTALVKKVKKPVTVKFRKGFDDDHINAVDLAVSHSPWSATAAPIAATR